MYLSDIHTHSIASGHGTTCTISDMAKAASQKGLKLLGITDHGPRTSHSGCRNFFLFPKPDLFAQEAFRCGIIIWN